MAQARLEQVNKRFGNLQVLQDIDLTINDGEFLIVVGPSGSGKSTLLRILAGLDTVTSGRVVIDNIDMTDLPPKERGIAMVFQNYALYPHMTVRENIGFGMRVRGERKADRERALARAVKMLRLDGLLDRKPRQLSGGQRQRVAMARAIVRTPRLFLMDEPLSNLDAKLRNEVRLSIMELQRKLACTMVYVTHDQIEAMTMADRVVVLDRGTVQQVGSPQQLYHRPANRFTAGFIGTPAMNILSLTRENGCFRLPDGTPLPPVAGCNGSLADLGQVLLGLRPEHLSPHRESIRENEHPSQPLLSLRTTITAYEMLGSEFLVHADQESGHLQYRQRNDGRLPVAGEHITLHFSMARAHLFDGSTGQRIN